MSANKSEISPGKLSQIESEGTAEKSKKETLIKQLNQIICICKGIKLARVIEGLPDSQTVAEVNKKVGSGCGACRGERCGPRIQALLKKSKKNKKS